MKLPKKFSSIPLEVSWEATASTYGLDIDAVLKNIAQRFILSRGILAYVYAFSNGKDIEIQSFRSSKGNRKKQVFHAHDSERIASRGSRLDNFNIKSILGTRLPTVRKDQEEKAELLLENGSSISLFPGYENHILRLLVLPPVYSMENVVTLKVGDRVLCPVLEYKGSKNFPKYDKMARPLLFPVEGNPEACEMLVYAKAIKITRIYKNESYARLVTPDGVRFLHLGLLIKPLAMIPFL